MKTPWVWFGCFVGLFVFFLTGRGETSNKARPRGTQTRATAARLMAEPALSTEAQGSHSSRAAPAHRAPRAGPARGGQGTGLPGTRGPAAPSSPSTSHRGPRCRPRNVRSAAGAPLVPRKPGVKPHSGQGGHSPGHTRCPRPGTSYNTTGDRSGSLTSRPTAQRQDPGARPRPPAPAPTAPHTVPENAAPPALKENAGGRGGPGAR